MLLMLLMFLVSTCVLSPSALSRELSSKGLLTLVKVSKLLSSEGLADLSSSINSAVLPTIGTTDVAGILDNPGLIGMVNII
jgi:hypothetical protein